jgi:Ca2+-dependent lipid-binding protein
VRAHAQVSLLEQPRLSYGLIVQGGDISFLPGLEAFINSVLREQARELLAPCSLWQNPLAALAALRHHLLEAH